MFLVFETKIYFIFIIQLARSESAGQNGVYLSKLEISRNADQKKIATQTRCTDEKKHSHINEVKGLYIFVEMFLLIFMRK